MHPDIWIKQETELTQQTEWLAPGIVSRRVMIGSLLGAVAALAGCSRRRPAGSAAVSLQLNWLPDSQHGGFYAAALQSTESQQGVSIEILPGGPGVDTLPKLAMRHIDLAIANADQVLLARAQQADLVALFAALQTSPRCIMVHESSGIRRFDQLTDLVLALGEGKAFAEYLKRHVPLTGVRIVPYTGTISQWLVDPKMAQQGYVFTEPLLATRNGGDPRALMVSQLGFDPYTSVLVARREWTERQPELARQVCLAVSQGWHDYLREPHWTNARIHDENPTVDLEMLDEAARVMAPLCTAGLAVGEPLGSMSAERWQTLADQLLEVGLLDQPAASIEQAFTNEFLPPRG